MNKKYNLLINPKIFNISKCINNKKIYKSIQIKKLNQQLLLKIKINKPQKNFF